MSIESDRQDRICAAVRDVLAERLGENIDLTDRPDRVERREPAVEEIWQSARCSFAVEHTRIEAFPGQVKDDQRFLKLVAPLEQALSGTIPGRYGLRIDLGAATSARVPYESAQRTIAEWVQATAPTMAVGSSAVLEGVLPFAVTLTRDGSDGSILLVARWLDSSQDWAAQRLVRIGSALDKKIPKLLRWSEGRESVLVLESDDLPLSNQVEIAKAAIACLSGRVAAPDYIVLVETESWPAMVVWFLKDREQVFPAVEDWGPHEPDLDPSILGK